MPEILGYDSTAVAPLTIDQVPAWRQMVGAKLWLNLTNPDDAALAQVGPVFGFNRQNLADCCDSHCAPYVDIYNGYLFIRMHRLPQGNEKATVEPFSLFLGQDFLVTVQGGPCTAVRELWSLYQTDLRLWQYGPDYLLHLLTHALMKDNFLRFEAIERQFNNHLLIQTNDQSLKNLFAQRQQLINLIQLIISQRDIVAQLSQAEHALLDSNVRYYLGHTYRQLAGLADRMVTLRDLTTNQIETQTNHQSSETHRAIEQFTVTTTTLLSILLLIVLFTAVWFIFFNGFF